MNSNSFFLPNTKFLARDWARDSVGWRLEPRMDGKYGQTDGRRACQISPSFYRTSPLRRKKREKELMKSKQVRIYNMFSRERWEGALMEGRSLFDLNSAVKKTRDGPLTDLRTLIESLVRDQKMC